MSNALQGGDLAYSSIEKQAYALVKVLKYFKYYFWNVNIVPYVLHPMVKDMLLHQDCNSTRGKWITNMQKYDLELKPTKLVHGEGLDRLMEKRRIHTIDKATI